MRVRALDQNGDWTFGKGIQDYLFLNNAIGQNIRTRLLSFLGDCFFAINDGLDWFNLLGKTNQLAINLPIAACIINTQGVTGLLELTVVISEARNISIQYNVQTIYSVQGLQGTIQYDLGAMG